LVHQGSLLLDAQASNVSLAMLEQQKSLLEESAAVEKRRLERALTAQCVCCDPNAVAVELGCADVCSMCK
jgi:hypothetical protein